MSKSKFWYLILAVLLAATLVLAACAPAAEEPAAEEPVAEEPAAEEPAAEEGAGKLEIFSWWTAGGEAEGLNGMFEVYSAQHPEVEIVNATVAGGAGTNAKAVLATRLQGGDPPDSFQVHAGLEVEKYEPAAFLQPIEDLYDFSVFPEDLLTLLEYEGHIWSMPVNIHRSNVLWYNKAIFEENGLEVPMTKDEFFEVSDALVAKGIIPVTMGTKDGWEAAHVFEGVLAATLGAEDYRGLWTGETPWTDPRVTEALEYFNKIMDYVNEDHAALTWDGAGEYFLEDKAAMMIMGDWTAGWFASKAYSDYGWAATPGSDGIFVGLSDSFSLPQGAPNEQAAKDWLAVCQSKEGQETFNPAKGSICARTDCDNEAFKAVPETYDYLTSAAEDWASDSIVPSVVHGAAAFESWATDWKDTISLFVASGDVAGTQEALQALCVDAGVCQ
jgi:glucose/mannose transport system substrate-binding protein